MKKYTIKKYITKSMSMLALCSLGLVSSCDDFLDIRPKGELPAEKLLVNATGFENAMYGVYASLASASLYGAQLSHNFIDLSAQYFVSSGNDFVTNALAYNYTNSNVESVINSVWSSMYTNIANVNNILINLENYNDGSFRYYNLYKGEALGLRAFMHFDLLRLFAENIQNNPNADGIPYSKTFSMKATPFSKASEVYDFIITDLKEAEQLLSDDQSLFTSPKVNPNYNFIKDREIHFNLYAVKATLARVYHYKGDMTNAAKYAKEVIDANKFSLLEQAEFNAGIFRGVLFPKEAIFGLFNAEYFETVRRRFLNTESFYSYDMRSGLVAGYSTGQVGVDYRTTAFFRRTTGSGAKDRLIKLVDQYQVDGNTYSRNPNYITGINLIRIVEMYYIMAEALLTTDKAEATRYFDMVLNSRGLQGLASQNPVIDLTLDRITNERYKEFIGEGQTFFNMKRLSQDIVKTDNTVVPSSNTVYVWPIPNDEKEFNN
ncbi:MAG: RagB/SusD family nutrient uptake outer membrane protein [Sphingobacterium composti]|uniref:RagB/SusD family nutrient uptake outer membrane protein n=1 Tax=Sphingobacterium composti TaxID=363260 RepID=UPI00135BA2B8|nr:RagB/SusD family nutrient uptake outer membrane protein [Sphingobacterium composti Ten et al. 2007 non Yoo et al. 2007]